MRGKQASGARQDPQPQRYQIRVRGRLGLTMCAAFPVFQAQRLKDQVEGGLGSWLVILTRGPEQPGGTVGAGYSHLKVRTAK